MLFKLAVRNMRRSLRDYALYFGTLIISVSIFYVFNSLSSQSFLQSALFRAPDHFTANIEATMATISMFISVLLIFLIIYGNSFIIKRRKKELGVYLTLGMERVDVAKILFGEIFLIAILSIVAGIGIGVPLTQLMSVLIFHLLGIYVPELTFAFSLSVVLRTALYFTVVFLSVIIINIATVANSKILNLLSGGSKQASNSNFLTAQSGVLFIVAIVGIGYWAFTMLTLELIETVQTIPGVEDEYWTQPGIDATRTTIGFVSGIVGTFAFFFSLSGLLVYIVKRSKRIAFRGLNIFALRQLTRRLHLNWLSLSFITLMMTVSISMLVTGSVFVLTNSGAMAYNNRPFDGVVSVRYEPDFDNLEVVDEVFLLREFQIPDVQIGSLIDIEIPDWMNWTDWIYGFAYEDVRRIFDYHNVPLPTPDSNEILLLVSDLDIDETYLLQEQIAISYLEDWNIADTQFEEIFDIVLTVVSENLLLTDDYIFISNQVVLVFPPSSDLNSMPFIHSWDGVLGREKNHYLFNFNTDERTAEPIFWEFVSTLPDVNWGWREYDIFSTSANSVFNATTASWIRVNSNLTMIFITFASLYIGGIFLLVSLTILFLQQMIDVVESEKRYATLSQLGVDAKMRSRSLLAQGIICFLIPLIIASIHSFLALQIYFIGEAGDLPAAVEFNQIARSMVTTFIGVIVVYIVYFVLAHIQTKRMLAKR